MDDNDNDENTHSFFHSDVPSPDLTQDISGGHEVPLFKNRSIFQIIYDRI